MLIDGVAIFLIFEDDKMLIWLLKMYEETINNCQATFSK